MDFNFIDITDEYALMSAYLQDRPACDCGTGMLPIGDTDMFRCSFCGAMWDLHDYLYRGPFSKILGPIFTDDYIPEGCEACGNPAYPKCKTSCNLFDD